MLQKKVASGFDNLACLPMISRRCLDRPSEKCICYPCMINLDVSWPVRCRSKDYNLEPQRRTFFHGTFDAGPNGLERRVAEVIK